MNDGLKAVVVMIVVVFLVIAGYILNILVFQPLDRATKVNDPDRTISLRAQFHQDFNQVIAYDQQLKTQDAQIAEYKNQYGEDRSKWSPAQESRVAQAELIRNGILSTRNNLIGEYNSKANNVDSSVWEDKNLPRHLDANQDYSSAS